MSPMGGIPATLSGSTVRPMGVSTLTRSVLFSSTTSREPAPRSHSTSRVRVCLAPVCSCSKLHDKSSESVVGEPSPGTRPLDRRQLRLASCGEFQHRPRRRRTPRSTGPASAKSIDVAPVDHPASSELLSRKLPRLEELTNAPRADVQHISSPSHAQHVHIQILPMTVLLRNAVGGSVGLELHVPLSKRAPSSSAAARSLRCPRCA